ncbi:MAG: flagellar hook-basal body protein [Lachnospiraceae bacterium]|nr:flagellar hook-basal body protein [Lachnospiraceae bacterium]
MMRALWSAASGMLAQQTNVDTISNNIANVNTVGFRSDKAEFKSLLYQNLQAKTTTANGEQKPIAAQVGLGTRVASITSSFSQGELTASDSNTAFAIEGDGMFSVRGLDNEMYFTRNGDFCWALGQNGLQLSSSEGYAVLDTTGNPIVLPEGVDANNVMVSSHGEIGYRDAEGNYNDLNMTIGTWQFNNPAGLKNISGTYFTETDASGEPLNEWTNPQLKRSSVHQGYLESSNVNVADEMVNMIIAQRAYELNSKAIQTADAMLGTANQLKS